MRPIRREHERHHVGNTNFSKELNKVKEEIGEILRNLDAINSSEKKKMIQRLTELQRHELALEKTLREGL
jgi:hypothetical protein